MFLTGANCSARRGWHGGNLPSLTSEIRSGGATETKQAEYYKRELPVARRRTLSLEI